MKQFEDEMSHLVQVPISIGELFDKISILEIKSERIKDAPKLVNIDRELELLHRVAAELGDGKAPPRLFADLKLVNGELWDAEDAIRDCERAGQFDAAFLSLARSIYRLNDRRAAAKREINAATNSLIVEEKSYRDY